MASEILGEIFKNWKSLLNIRILKGTRRERIECFLYGRLTAIMVIAISEGYASWYAFSSYKLTNWLKRKDRLAKTIRSVDLHEIFVVFRHDVSESLCKQIRKRKTTCQLAECGMPYTDSFSNDESNSLIPNDKAA